MVGSAREAPIGAAGPGTRAMPKTVLIVEDNELNMKLFNDLLEAHGYATLKTGHGIEAMELARAHRPDLILMDIQLPEVSGLEVTRWLKQDEELKPISVAKFISTVKTYLDADPVRP